MDLVGRVRALVAAVDRGEEPPYLAREVRFHGPDGDLGPEEFRAWLRGLQGGPDGRLVITQTVPRRNVVFVGYARHGPEPLEGTWVLSFDREGRVAHWSEA